MTYASEDLIAEHAGILRALKILDIMTEILGKNGHVDINDIKDIIRFFRTFADKCHHGKEETFLFPAIRDLGRGETNALVSILLKEHDELRSALSAMTESFQVNTFDTHVFRHAADNYSSLIRAHIDKEDNTLFPLADTGLNRDEQNSILDKFEKFESDVMGKNTHEEFHRMLESLELKYSHTE